MIYAYIVVYKLVNGGNCNIEQGLVKKSEKKYRDIFNNIQDVVFQTDPDGIFWGLSPSVKEITGYSSEELIGRPTNILQTDEEEKDTEIEVDFDPAKAKSSPLLDDALEDEEGAKLLVLIDWLKNDIRGLFVQFKKLETTVECIDMK